MKTSMNLIGQLLVDVRTYIYIYIRVLSQNNNKVGVTCKNIQKLDLEKKKNDFLIFLHKNKF